MAIGGARATTWSDPTALPELSAVPGPTTWGGGPDPTLMQQPPKRWKGYLKGRILLNIKVGILLVIYYKKWCINSLVLKVVYLCTNILLGTEMSIHCAFQRNTWLNRFRWLLCATHEEETGVANGVAIIYPFPPSEGSDLPFPSRWGVWC